METMTSTRQMLAFVAVLAFAILSIAHVSAFGSFTSIEVNGIEAVGSNPSVAVFAGQTIPVRVIFKATQNAEDVRVKAWVSGDKDVAISSERFDVLANQTYTRYISLNVPFDLNDELDEPLMLEVSIESKNDGVAAQHDIALNVQRESYLVEVLDADMPLTAKAGEIVPVDIVLKNRGRKFADDTFVKVMIPALGVEERAYFGDLSALDQSHPDKEDAVERRIYVRIPAAAAAGVYAVDIDAFNSDSSTSVSKKIAISAVSDESRVLSAVKSKSFAAGAKGTYSMTLVNAGDKVKVYELVVDTEDGLTVDVDEQIVALPAGTSKTVKMTAMAEKAGSYRFTVIVHSDNQVVKSETFTATVEGNKAISGTNTTVLLTVVLAIVFVVLLVVLIVLLTRKPAKNEEFGESYY